MIALLTLSLAALAATLIYIVVLKRRYKHRLRALSEAYTTFEATQERKNEEKIRMLHNTLSHSVRMPMSIISGYAGLLSGGMVADENLKQEYLAKICDRITYLNGIFDNILTGWRSENEIYQLVKLPFDLVKLIQSTAYDIAPAAKTAGIDIHVDAPSPHLTINADAGQLTKILYNLFDNAIKHMGRPGRIDIMISETDGNALVVFKDDGKGLAAAEIDKVFAFRFRGSNCKSDMPGEGFGLSLVKILVELHGGKVYAKSDEDKGMAIFIVLPLTD